MTSHTPKVKINTFYISKGNNNIINLINSSSSSLKFVLAHNKKENTGAINVVFNICSSYETDHNISIEVRCLIVFSEFIDRPILTFLLGIARSSLNIIIYEILKEANEYGFVLNADIFFSKFKECNVEAELLTELNRVFPV